MTWIRAKSWKFENSLTESDFFIHHSDTDHRSPPRSGYHIVCEPRRCGRSEGLKFSTTRRGCELCCALSRLPRVY